MPHGAPDRLIVDRQVDRRWIRIKRPTIIASELSMENLEVTRHPSTGSLEAPLQLKSNCGTLVIDDLGRHRISAVDLLNRWITPLESGHDFLNLPSGRKVQVPFDQLIIFSTNLEPRDLLDDAFLRRIPYKIDVVDPTEAEFRDVFHQEAKKLDAKYEEDVIDYLFETHYRVAGRSLRNCHPRDLLGQVANACDFRREPTVVTRVALDTAVKNYFGLF